MGSRGRATFREGSGHVPRGTLTAHPLPGAYHASPCITLSTPTHTCTHTRHVDKGAMALEKANRGSDAPLPARGHTISVSWDPTLGRPQRWCSLRLPCAHENKENQKGGERHSFSLSRGEGGLAPGVNRETGFSGFREVGRRGWGRKGSGNRVSQALGEGRELPHSAEKRVWGAESSKLK